MKITKFGHSCLLVEEGDARILIDPGSYSTLQNDARNIDAILITHEHQDHLSIESLRAILKNSPEAKIYTNAGVGEKLKAENIPFEFLEDAQRVIVKGALVEGFGRDHAIIYPSLPRFDNTGYLIAGRLFHPGDALLVPSKPVEILALPVIAPWSKISEVIDYAKTVKPKIAFPIHDGMLKNPGGYSKWPETFLAPEGIEWKVIEDGKSLEVN